jgi:arylformamidase
MKIQFDWNKKQYECNLKDGADLSISFKEDFNQVNCFYAPFFSQQPVKMGDFIGSVKEGGPVNFYNTFINIHGSGTHTECAGHIRQDKESVNALFNEFFGIADLISVYPTKFENGNRVITRESLELLWNETDSVDFLILRTLPNPETKKQMHYSGTNPPFIEENAIHYMVEKNVRHLLVDLPSVDQEVDGGFLRAHKGFWSGERYRFCTITELIYVPDHLKDGRYMINLQMAPLENDASPSRPVIFPLYAK